MAIVNNAVMSYITACIPERLILNPTSRRGLGNRAY
jgi:hypothetical protein